MNRLYIIIILITLLGFTACNDDFLDRAPKDGASSGNMWTTDNMTEMGVIGVYQALRNSINTGGVSGYELYQFDSYASTGQYRRTWAILTGSISPTNGLFSNVWREQYEGIHRANDAIYNIPLKSPSEPAKKARLVAESKFLRAYFYFRLNQLFKGVPVYLEPVSDEECTRSQETEEYVWNEVVIKDLTDCINEPNLPDMYLSSQADFGRATKGAAYALRGKTYLYMGKYTEAAADFAKVKECGHSLYTGNYADLFKEVNEKNAEIIFSLQHIGLPSQGSTTQFFCGNRSSFGSCWNELLVSSNLVDKYEYEDGRLFNWDDIIPNYSTMDPKWREVYFLRDTVGVYANYVNAGLSSAEALSRTKTIMSQVDGRLNLLEKMPGNENVRSKYLPSGNEARIKAAYQGRDSRLNANVIVPYSTYLGSFSGADNLVTSRWPIIGALQAPPLGDLNTDTQSQYYYLYRKFVYTGSTETPNRTYGPIDFPIIRYADVLLMWAEALNAQGKYAEALPLVNEVRTRAKVAALQITDNSKPTFVKDAADMFKRIQKERAMEFPNEGITFFDEMRWKTWKANNFDNGGGVKLVWGANESNYIWQGDNLYIWPVPAVEIERNSNMEKTTGWTY